MRIVAIINQKGGCGKTTTAINLAGVLSKSGLRTLLVDMDPQSHCAAGLGVPEHRIDLDIGDAMVALGTRNIDPARLLWRVASNLDLAPSRMKLAGLEASRGGLADKPDKERRLGGVLAQYSRDYDVALIDCSPAIGLLTFNALTAASTVLIPVETGFFSLQGAAKQVHTVTTVGKRLGAEVPLWLLPTIHDPDGGLARDLLLEIRRRFADRVTPVVIRRDDRLREAASYGQPIVEYAPTSTGAADYTALGQWLSQALDLRPGTPRTERPARLVAEPELDLSSIDDPHGIRVVTEPGDDAEITRRVLGQTSLTGELSAQPAAAPRSEAIDQAGLSRTPEPNFRDTITAFATAVRNAPEEPLPLSRAEDMALRAARIARRDPAPVPSTVPAAPTPPVFAASAPVPAELPRRHSVLVLEADLNMVEPKATPKSGAAERLAGARVTSQGVLFAQPISIGRSVAVAGDFNAWSSETHRLRRNESIGVFELCVKLPPGRHVYRMVIDGQWSADPFNDEFELNPFGEPNSVVRVPQG